jgi:hypothetical protein
MNDGITVGITVNHNTQHQAKTLTVIPGPPYILSASSFAAEKPAGA